MKKLVCVLLSFLMIIGFSACSEKEVSKDDDVIADEIFSDDDNVEESSRGTDVSVDKNEEIFIDSDNDTNEDSDTDDEDSTVAVAQNPVATIVVKDFGTIKVELYYNKAPNTVRNFISLSNDGFYDGLTFHRVIETFVIQGGCPEGTGMGDPGYSIKGEFSYNGFEGNDIAHERGVISMARGSYSMDSAGSQFFIMHETAPHLDGQFAAFGMVTEGLDVVDAIASVDTDYYDKPLTDVVIESITVETFGVVYAEPDIL